MTNFLDKYVIVEPPETIGCVYKINDILGEEGCCRDSYFENKKAVNGDRLEKREASKKARRENNSVDMVIYLKNQTHNNEWLLVECRCRGENLRNITKNIAKKMNSTKNLISELANDVSFFNLAVLLVDENILEKKFKEQKKNFLIKISRAINLKLEALTPYQLAKNLIQTTGVYP